jgi:hypothetical protein
LDKAPPNLHVRSATPADLGAIRRIYNEGIADRIATLGKAKQSAPAEVTPVMQHLSRAEFQRRFPRQAPRERFSGASETFVVEHDMVVDGLIQHLVVRSGASAVITGLVEKSLVVERGGTAYVDGLIDGDAVVDGALCIDGHLAGRLRGSGAVYDPAEPPDAGRGNV